MNETKQHVDANERYNITQWSQHYFGINETGEVYVAPNVDAPHYTATLTGIANQIQSMGISLPVLVRFPQILHHRVKSLCAAFNNAISAYQYTANYLLVYPIKVNQQKEVIDEIIASQSEIPNKQLGLEAGSKPELLAILALAQKASSVIICNGYKDIEYIRLALIGSKLGHKVFIVLEKMSELETILQESEKLHVSPILGIRVRLASQGKGKWQASGGEKSKFGLSASQVLTVLDRLKQHNKLECLQLVHFHLGSQVANIRDIRNGVSEAARFYCELRQLGAHINYFDVGGGLAIDYDGTRSQSSNSMNYSLAEYANNIVGVLGDICKLNHQPMPTIISESGRSLTAHHAVLISNVIGVESYTAEDISTPHDNAPMLLKNMWQSLQQLSLPNKNDRAIIEIFHDCQHDLAEVHSQFVMGLLTLEQRAWAEKINMRICYELDLLMDVKNRFHRPIIDELAEKLADKFFVNFSLFQSLPDAWGIHQIFPVLPLSGLTNDIVDRAVILDITCDSCGAIDHYVQNKGIETTLPVPKWNSQQQYLLGFFLVGAYQEILGDMHNLFGDTHCATVIMNDQGQTEITHLNEGDTVEDMLRYVHIESKTIKDAYIELVNANLPENERSAILNELEQGLKGYTYLEDF
jgi:arginine decarboxylase